MCYLFSTSSFFVVLFDYYYSVLINSTLYFKKRCKRMRRKKGKRFFFTLGAVKVNIFSSRRNFIFIMEKLYFHREETLFSTGETLLDRVLVVKCCPQNEEEPTYGSKWGIYIAHHCLSLRLNTI